MERAEKRVCLHCGEAFTPEPRNTRHQQYCGQEACKAASTNDTRLVWVDAEFLGKQEGVELPIFAPYAGDTRGFHTWSNQRAVKAGLVFRPIAATAKDTLAWFQALPEERRNKLRGALTAEREAELLAKFRAK